MRIAVVGCGAVGSFYGAKLARRGSDVHFLLRSDYDVVRRQGLQVRSPLGDFHLQPHCARRPEEIGRCDLVLIALKTTANIHFSSLLPPLAGPHTALLTLQNGLGNEEQLARLFPPDRIFGGLCFVCLNRTAPGVIHHIAHGQIILGDFHPARDSQSGKLSRLFIDSGVSCSVTDNLARTHWEKLVWNIPFNGLGVASAAGYEAALRGKRNHALRLGPCLTTDELLRDDRWEALVRALMLEVIAAARALKFNVPDTLADENIDRTRSMGAYRASTLIDFERGQPLEIESMFLKPLSQARAAGARTPHLARLCRLLSELDPPAAHL